MKVDKWIKEKKELCGKALDCPDCGNVGWYEGGSDGISEQTQCQFCYTRPDSAFNLKALRIALKTMEKYRDALKFYADSINWEDDLYLDADCLIKAMGEDPSEYGNSVDGYEVACEALNIDIEDL